jgi:hypothetical protein
MPAKGYSCRFLRVPGASAYPPTATGSQRDEPTASGKLRRYSMRAKIGATKMNGMTPRAIRVVPVRLLWQGGNSHEASRRLFYTFCGKLIDKTPDYRILFIGHLRHGQFLNDSPELVFPPCERARHDRAQIRIRLLRRRLGQAAPPYQFHKGRSLPAKSSTVDSATVKSPPASGARVGKAAAARNMVSKLDTPSKRRVRRERGRAAARKVPPAPAASPGPQAGGTPALRPSA